MDNLSAELKEKRKNGGTKAVIDHLESFLKLNGNVEKPKLEAAVMRFIISEQDELEYCAIQIEECLRRNKIPVDNVNKILAQARRRGAALETIKQRWGYENIVLYGWHIKGVHFLEDLANIARRKTLEDAFELFNRVILESRDYGHWGREGHCPEQPIEQTHLTKVLKHLIEPGKRKNDKARMTSKSQSESSIVPLGQDELESKRHRVDSNGLIIASSAHSQARSNRDDSPQHASMMGSEETMSQTRDIDCTLQDLDSNVDHRLESVFDTPTEASSGSSPHSYYTRSGVDLTNFEGEAGGHIDIEQTKTDRPNWQATDQRDSTRSDSSLGDLICEKFGILHRGMLENTVKTTESQQDFAAKIIAAFRDLASEGRSTAEAAQSTHCVDQNTRLMHALEKKLAERSCKCENMLTPQMQEGVISGLYEGLSSQLAQLKEELEFTRSSITQRLTHQVPDLDKDLAGEIRAQTQKDLDILYKATNNHLEQLYRESRDCIAHAGMTIADGLKAISAVGLTITNNLSTTLKKHMEETAHSQRREYEKTTIQMKHECSVKGREIHDQQTVLIESQTKAIVSTMSTIQNSVISMHEEMRALRRDFETHRGVFAKSKIIDTSNHTPDDGEDLEDKDKGLEVFKRYHHDGSTAESPEIIHVQFSAPDLACNAPLQRRSSDCNGSMASSLSQNPDYGHDKAQVARSWVIRRKDMIASSHERARTGDISELGIIRLESSIDRSEQVLEEGLSNEEPPVLTLDLETASIFVPMSGYLWTGNQAASDQISVQDTADSSTYIAVERAPVDFKHANQSVESMKAEGVSASAVVTKSRQNQQAGHIRMLNNVAVCSERELPELVNASKAVQADVMESLPPHDASAALETENLESQPMLSSGSDNMFLGSPLTSFSPTSSWKNEAMTVLLETGDANSADETNVVDMSSQRSQEPIQSSEDADDKARPESSEKSGIIDPDSEASILGNGATSGVLSESTTGTEKPRDGFTFGEKLMAGAESCAWTEDPDVIPSESTREKTDATLEFSEPNDTNPKQPVYEIAKPDHVRSSEVPASEQHHIDQMASQDNEHDHRSDFADNGATESSGAVANKIDRSCQNNRRTSHATEDSKFNPGETPLTTLPQPEGLGQEVEENDDLESPCVGLVRGEPMITSTTCPLVLNEGTEAVNINRSSSSPMTDQNLSEILDHVPEQIGPKHNPAGASLDQPRLLTRGSSQLGISLSAPFPTSVWIPPTSEDHESCEQSLEQGKYADESSLKRFDTSKSDAFGPLLDKSSFDQPISSLPYDSRGRKRPRTISDEGYKNKLPKIQGGMEAEPMIRSPDDGGESGSAAVFSGPFTFSSWNNIPTSFRNETSFGFDEQGSNPVGSRTDVDNRHQSMKPVVLPGSRTLEKDKPTQSTSEPSPLTQDVTVPRAQTRALNTSPTSMAHDSDREITRCEDPSSRQPASSTLEEVRGLKRPRDVFDDGKMYMSKRPRSTSDFEGNGGENGPLRDVPDSDIGRCERNTKSGGVEVMNSSSPPNWNPELLRSRGSDLEGVGGEPSKLGEMTLVSANGGWKVLVERNKLERERMKFRTQNVRNTLQRSRRKTKTRITSVFPKDLNVNPSDGHSPSLEEGGTSETTRWFTAVYGEYDDLQSSSQVESKQPLDNALDGAQSNDLAKADVSRAEPTLEHITNSGQTSASRSSAVPVPSSDGYDEDVQQQVGSGTSEIVEYAVIDNFSQTVPELEP